MTVKDANKSSTALRSFHVLEVVAHSTSPLLVSEVAERSNLDRATCYRMLKTIEEAGYILSDPKTKTYRLSRKVLSLARNLMTNDNTTQLVDVTLSKISEITQETCHYSVLEGNQTILTQLSKGSQLVAVNFDIGTKCPLHVTSVGKVILANQSDDFIDKYLQQELESFTEFTIANPIELKKELDEIKINGVAYDRHELSVGMKCVAIPVAQADGKIESGVSISGPETRFTDENLEFLANTMKPEAKKLHEALKGNG